MSTRRQQIEDAFQGPVGSLLSLQQSRADDRIDLLLLPALEVGRGQLSLFDPHVVAPAESLLQDGDAQRLVVYQHQPLAADEHAAQRTDARPGFQHPRTQVGLDLLDEPTMVAGRPGKAARR